MPLLHQCGTMFAGEACAAATIEPALQAGQPWRSSIVLRKHGAAGTVQRAAAILQAGLHPTSTVSPSARLSRY